MDVNPCSHEVMPLRPASDPRRGDPGHHVGCRRRTHKRAKKGRVYTMYFCLDRGAGRWTGRRPIRQLERCPGRSLGPPGGPVHGRILIGQPWPPAARKTPLADPSRAVHRPNVGRGIRPTANLDAAGGCSRIAFKRLCTTSLGRRGPTAPSTSIRFGLAARAADENRAEVEAPPEVARARECACRLGRTLAGPTL